MTEKFEKVGSKMSIGSSDHEVQEKMTIILSIKVEEMQKKVKILTNEFHYPNIFSVFGHHSSGNITYEDLKNGILTVISDIKEKIKISEDDVKTIFHVLDEENQGFITINDVEKLKDKETITQKMKEFYESRINKDMVKNTLFKLGRMKNSNIQIYQLKNASVLEFQQIEESIVNENVQQQQFKPFIRKKIPHFGPLKGASKWKKGEKHANSSDTKFNYSSSSTMGMRKNRQVNEEREKIEKILRSSKE